MSQLEFRTKKKWHILTLINYQHKCDVLAQRRRQFPDIVRVHHGPVLLQRHQKDSLLHKGQVQGQDTHQQEVSTQLWEENIAHCPFFLKLWIKGEDLRSSPKVRCCFKTPTSFIHPLSDQTLLCCMVDGRRCSYKLYIQL